MRKFTMSWQQIDNKVTASLKVIEDTGAMFEELTGSRSFDSFDEATSWAYKEASIFGFERVRILSDHSFL